MKRTAARLGAAALVMMAVAGPAHGQELEQGTRTGSMSPPGGAAIPVTFEVGVVSGDLSIVMSNPQFGDIPFMEPRLAGDELTFWWEPGTRVECTLLRGDDRAFEGTCSDVQGTTGAGNLTMTPPAA